MAVFPRYMEQPLPYSDRLMEAYEAEFSEDR